MIKSNIDLHINLADHEHIPLKGKFSLWDKTLRLVGLVPRFSKVYKIEDKNADGMFIASITAPLGVYCKVVDLVGRRVAEFPSDEASQTLVISKNANIKVIAWQEEILNNAS
jgi:hypothetical protein